MCTGESHASAQDEDPPEVVKVKDQEKKEDPDSSGKPKTRVSKVRRKKGVRPKRRTDTSEGEDGEHEEV